MKGKKLPQHVPPLLKTHLWLATALGQSSYFLCRCYWAPSIFPTFVPNLVPNIFVSFPTNLPALQESKGNRVSQLHGSTDFIPSAQMISFCLCSWSYSSFVPRLKCPLFQEGFLNPPLQVWASPLCPCYPLLIFATRCCLFKGLEFFCQMKPYTDIPYRKQ